MVPLHVKSTSGYPAVVHCSALYKCGQISSTPSSKSNCTFYSSTHLMRQMIHITTAKHAIDRSSLTKPNLFQKEAVAFYTPFLSGLDYRQRKRLHVILLDHHLLEQTNILASSILSKSKAFYSLHYTNKANQTSGWCRHEPGSQSVRQDQWTTSKGWSPT